MTRIKQGQINAAVEVTDVRNESFGATIHVKPGGEVLLRIKNQDDVNGADTGSFIDQNEKVLTVYVGNKQTQDKEHIRISAYHTQSSDVIVDSNC